MIKEPIRILLVDDDEDDYIIARDLLKEAGRNSFEVVWVSTYETALEAIGQEAYDVYLFDYRLGERNGLELLQEAVVTGICAPVILLTAQGDHDVDKAALELGASDYLDKRTLSTELLERSIRYARERKRVEKMLKQYSEKLEEMVEERTRDLKEAQEELVRKEKLAVLGQLGGGVGHELRNPLGAIKNAGYFLNLAIEDPEPEVKETLEIIEREVATSEKIINSLLDFAHQVPPVKRRMALKDIIQGVLSRTSVPENVEVVEQIDETLPKILADPDQLAQVFENLIRNAFQAMSPPAGEEKGGRLIIATKARKPGYVFISFSDTGVGIPEDDLVKVFEPLFTTKAKGIGLGLALGLILVEGHGGAIEVESEKGKGSTFTVNLPLGMDD
jgi:signal transduction histidine kinase